MRVVAIADMHVGSRVALAKEKHCKEGQGIRDKIFSFWEKAVASKWGAPDVLIIDGDIIEGQNRKTYGIGTWSPDIKEQCLEAIELIKMWNAKHIYIIRGSGYHVEADKSGFQAEEYIAERLGSEPYPDKSGNYSGWHWYISVDGVTFHVSHSIGISTVFHYKSTPTAKEMLYAKLNDMLRHNMDKYKTNIVLRAHAHYFNAVEYSNSLGMVIPCWKALDEYMLKKGAIAMSPDLGYVGFDISAGQWTYEKNLLKLTDVQEAPHSIIKGEK